MNVWADLSGLVVGDDGAFATEEARDAKSDLAHAIQRAIHYSERPNRFLYGTDWPLAPMAAYREFIKEAVPAQWHEQVFEENARRLFRLG
jgi:predicted TIM-barrel fold metal-dependent hydrolase